MSVAQRSVICRKLGVAILEYSVCAFDGLGRMTSMALELTRMHGTDKEHVSLRSSGAGYSSSGSTIRVKCTSLLTRLGRLGSMAKNNIGGLHLFIWLFLSTHKPGEVENRVEHLR